jgi:TetR/AcrR family transcriptional repressor of bet genes
MTQLSPDGNNARKVHIKSSLFHVMSLTPIKEIRRRELLDAAFKTIKKLGLHAATISRIAKEAGVSKGIIHHYFTDRETLIELAVRHTLSLRHKAVVARLKAAQTPSERLWAIISVNLDHNYLDAGFCRAWISIAAEAAENMRFAAIVRAHHSREQSNLIHALRQLEHHENIHRVAVALKLLFEGARHRAGFLTQKLTPEQEKAHVLAYLGTCVSNFDPAIAERD